jgi:hypothetical protein
MGFMWNSAHRLRPHRMIWGCNNNYDSEILLAKLQRPTLRPMPRMAFKPEPKIGIDRRPSAEHRINRKMRMRRTKP